MQQQIFDKLVLKMIAQGKPARDSTGYHYWCKPERVLLKSPLGFLIPESIYNLDMEKNDVATTLNYPELRIYKDCSDLINSLEVAVRDDSYLHSNCSHFIHKLSRVAKLYELSNVVLTHFEQLSSWKTARMRAVELLKKYNI